MVLPTDARGWILTCVSGIACTIGAAIICVDLLVQQLPGQRNFRIQDSNGFLAGALSLSFGVMLFSSLNTMLPEAQDYLRQGGLSDRLSAWVNIVCFMGGVIGIQAFSRVLHHFIPSNVVDCDHTHDEGTKGDGDRDGHRRESHGSFNKPASLKENATVHERTPLISRTQSTFEGSSQTPSIMREPIMEQVARGPTLLARAQRPRLQPRLTTRMATLITGAKSSCDEGGPCYGYSDPCGFECFKISDRVPPNLFGRSFPAMSRHPLRSKSATTAQLRPKPDAITSSQEPSSVIEYQNQATQRPLGGDFGPASKGHKTSPSFRGQDRHEEFADIERMDDDNSISGSSTANEATHHHHVPENAFYSIGLQTSLAIALHKLPEGFITYATNHANPELGFSVFMALFIHNFSEGFAMALPMYLALNNRLKAMAISSVLGGISQPLGAGIAALWFHLAGSGDKGPGELVYGCMFSITAGIMASVALQLFSESLTLTHNRHICTIFAFVGMAILQVSHALTA